MLWPEIESTPQLTLIKKKKKNNDQGKSSWKILTILPL